MDKELYPLASLGEKILGHLTFETPGGLWTVYPAGGYSVRSGLEFGLMPVYSWKNPEQAGTTKTVNTLSSSLQFSTKGMVELRSELEWYLSPRWQWTGRFEVLRINDQYWAPWSLNPAGTPYDYQTKRFGLSTQVLRHLGRQLHLGVQTQLWHYRFSEQEAGSPINDISGFEGGWLVGVGPVVVLDRRDHVLYPHSGSYLKATGTWFNQESFATHQNFLLDARQFIGVGQSVIALQGLWEYVHGNPPFYLLPQLGGKDRLRGIGHSKRVVDQAVWLLRSELRFPLWWRFGAVAFVETGQAAHRPSFDWEELVFSQGAGLRFRILPREPLHLRIDAAWSSENTKGLFISLKEAF